MMRRMASSVSGTLRIQQESHSGFLTDCRTVEFSDKPRIVRIEPPSPLTFDMKEQIRLTCVAEGNPTPKYVVVIVCVQTVGLTVMFRFTLMHVLIHKDKNTGTWA